jgi:hypothetical protein
MLETEADGCQCGQKSNCVHKVMAAPGMNGGMVVILNS